MPKKFGECAYIYGVGYDNVDCIEIESISEESMPEFEAEGLDEGGNVAAVVNGDEKTTFTISGFMKSSCSLGSYQGAGNCKISLTPVDGGAPIECLVEKFSINRSNRDFAKAEITATNWPSATICCPVEG